MSTLKLAARVAMNDVGERMVSAIEALDAGDFDKAFDMLDEAAGLLTRAARATEMLEDGEGEPS